MYVDEINAFLDENDGWNADGSMGGREYNLTPFSDFSYKDSSGNKWKGYTPKNSPYKVSTSGKLARVDATCAVCSRRLDRIRAVSSNRAIRSSFNALNSPAT